MKLYDTVIEMKLLALPETHVHVIKARQHVAELLQRLGRYDESVATREKVLVAQIETSGASSIDVAVTKLELALTSELQKEYVQSLALLKEALVLFEGDRSTQSKKRTSIDTGLSRCSKDAEDAIARVNVLIDASVNASFASS